MAHTLKMRYMQIKSLNVPGTVLGLMLISYKTHHGSLVTLVVAFFCSIERKTELWRAKRTCSSSLYL